MSEERPTAADETGLGHWVRVGEHAGVFDPDDPAERERLDAELTAEEMEAVRRDRERRAK